MQKLTVTTASPAALPLAPECASTRSSGLQGSAVRLICGVCIVCATLVLKLSVPPFSGLGISSSLFLLPAAALVGFAFQALGIDARRLATFLLLTGVLSVISLFGAVEISISSFAMFTAVHLPFVFVAKQATATPAPARNPTGEGLASSIQSTFLNLALVLAGLGIAQFFLQR